MTRMKKYRIHLIGCDDTTMFDMVLYPHEVRLIEKLKERSREVSHYQCMPTLDIYETPEEEEE